MRKKLVVLLVCYMAFAAVAAMGEEPAGKPGNGTLNEVNGNEATVESSYELSQGGSLVFCGSVPSEKRKGVVLLCPGGAYVHLSQREGDLAAPFFAREGWLPAVVHYSLAKGETVGTTPLQQLGEAVSIARKLFPGDRVVVAGFSAGGHLACSLGVHWKTLGLERPDALILGYPVVTAGNYTHGITMRSLVGEGDRAFFSLENFVTGDMPPTFLWHTVDDGDVPVQNSLMLAEAMTRAGVPFEMHLFPHGAHGLSLAVPGVDDPATGRVADAHVAHWFPLCLEWLEKIK